VKHDTANVKKREQLTDKQYQHGWKIVEDYLRKRPSIRNRQFREITGLSYDQAINFFKRATTERRLERVGHASATHYVLQKRVGS
jgi:hypothetical protein